MQQSLAVQVLCNGEDRQQAVTTVASILIPGGCSLHPVKNKVGGKFC